MEISIKWNVCRVCLQEPDKKDGTAMRKIFNDPKLAKQIYDCAGVTMKPDDCLPEKICRNCLLVLKYAVNFRTTCRNSDEYLQSVIRKTKSATSLFKLDKHREESMDLVDEVIELIFDDDNVNAEEEGRGDSVKGKRTRIQLIENANKKPKVDGCGGDEHVLLCMNESLTQSERYKGESGAERQRAFAMNVHSTEEVIESVKETNLIEIADSYDEEEHQQVEIGKNCIEDVEESDCTKIRETKITSECSIIEDDDYIEDCDEEQNSNLDVSNKHEDDNALQSFAVTEVKHEITDRKDACTPTPLRTNAFSQISEDTDELFYILNEAEIKSESAQNDEIHIESPPAIEFIQLEEPDEEDGKLSDLAITTLEQVEYLVDDSVEETFGSEGRDERVPRTSSCVTFKKVHHNTRKKVDEMSFYVCDVCGNNFTSRSLMNYHMKVHRNEKNYECELCFKRFNAACNLTAHMRIHTGEKKYECQFCGRRFTDRSTHIKHERIHTNEKPFTCTICAKSFSLSTTLKAHEKIHTGDKPHKCETCDKSFKLPHQLKAHFKTYLHKMLSVEQLLEDEKNVSQSSK